VSSSALAALPGSFPLISRPAKHLTAKKNQEKSLEAPNLILSVLFHLLSRVIWLGDLNYRIALSYRSVKALVEMHNWKQLLEKDQVSSYCPCGLATMETPLFVWYILTTGISVPSFA
jgi:ABC-type spermidine/putrescine transport system permease subunit I